MAHLEIKRTPQEDGSDKVELQIADIKACFFITPEMTIAEVRSRFDDALKGLSHKILMTIDTTKDFLKLLIPEFSQKITILPPSLSEVEEHLQWVVETLEQNFREAFSVSNTWTRVKQFLEWNGYYWNWGFDFGDFLLENGVFYTLYSGNYSRSDAKKILNNNNNNKSSVNIWDKTLDAIIEVLIKSGFPISD